MLTYYHDRCWGGNGRSWSLKLRHVLSGVLALLMLLGVDMCVYELSDLPQLLLWLDVRLG